MIIKKHTDYEVYTIRNHRLFCEEFGGVTQVPGWIPDNIVVQAVSQKHFDDVPVIPCRVKGDLVVSAKRGKQRKTEAGNDDFGMHYRYYSLLYKKRELSDLMKYPDIEDSTHDFEFFSASPSGVAFQLTRLAFLKKQDYAIINNIRSGYVDVIVGYVIPESVLETNTWEYAEVSVNMDQSIRVTWRH